MKKPSQLLIVLTVLLSASLACARTGRPTPIPSVSTPSLPAGELTRTLTHDNRERSYILYVPASVDWSKPVPLVFVFHGGTGNARNAIKMSGFNAVADRYGFLVVYPNGTSRLSDEVLLTWNGGSCCGYAQTANIDDVGFVRAIAADVQTLARVDPKRIYATGMSNGGIMSYRLACQAADLIAAIAPVSGTQNFAPCQPSQAVSVIHFHGTADEHLPYDGGVGSQSLTGVAYTSVEDSLAFWILHNHCPSHAQIEQYGDVTHLTYAPCDLGASVELYKIEGGGHAWPGADGPGWPGGDEPSQSISATALIWEFFMSHPKP